MIQGTHNPIACAPNQKPIMECTLLDYGMLEAKEHLYPEASGFWRYAVSEEGNYKHFKDAEGNAIVVTQADLQSGFVEIWVTNGVAKKVILYQGIKNTVSGSVENIIGTDSLTLFIESSAGDLLMADDLNTTLTPSVERYFKDYTEQVVQWQWFRESGTTQEDKDADGIWAMDKTSQILELQTDDFTHNIHTQAVTFVCQAIVNNQKITQKITI